MRFKLKKRDEEHEISSEFTNKSEFFEGWNDLESIAKVLKSF